MGKNDKKAVDLRGLDKTQFEALSRGGEESLISNQGVAGGKRVEAVPNFVPFDTDKIVSNENNAWIVLTRDRPANITSGYGGRGDTQAAAIDIVVGRQGANPQSNSWTGPNFRTDAARIYISQKSDIDEYFGLTEGTVGDIKTKSAIGMKADGVRLIAREGIKLVTTTDVTNSLGKKVESVGNIDLIAGNNTDLLEPLVKGYRLREALEQMSQRIDELVEVLNGFVTYQMAFNSATTTHTHQCAGPWGAPTAFPSIEMATSGPIAATNMATRTVPSLAAMKMTTGLWKLNHLNPIGKNFILSDNVNTT